jgi:hypothetical protein
MLEHVTETFEQYPRENFNKKCYMGSYIIKYIQGN